MIKAIAIEVGIRNRGLKSTAKAMVGDKSKGKDTRSKANIGKN